MRGIHNPHDKFFRASMQSNVVSRAFFRTYLPENIRSHLDFDSLTLQNNSYLNKELRESFSDIVYECRLAGSSAALVLLVEHQSKPDRWLPFRVHLYLLNLLNTLLKAKPDASLPAAYAMVFYHGEQSPYPYSLNLQDCFNDPLGLMKQWFGDRAIPLVDVNQLDDQALLQQQWVGAMALALKHIRDQDISQLLIETLQNLDDIAEPHHIEKEFIRALLNYLLGAGNISDIDDFLTQSQDRLRGPILRGELMTAAEKLEQRGVERGIEKGIEQGIERGRAEGREEGRQEGQVEGVEKTAINLIREGAEFQFIVKVTNLPESRIHELQAHLNSGESN